MEAQLKDMDKTISNHHEHHNHTHSHAHTKAVLNRLHRATGHLQAVSRMVEQGRDCSEVLIQLSAVTSALQNTAKIILNDHIDHCLVHAVENNDKITIDALKKAIEKVMKF